MNRRRPAALGCLGALLLSCVSSLFGLYQWDRRTSITAEAPAEITRVFQTGTRRDQNRRTTIEYRYAVNGTTYEARFTKAGPNTPPGGTRPNFEVGQPAKVCYNPERPQISEPFPTTFRCPSSRLPQFLRRPATRER